MTQVEIVTALKKEAEQNKTASAVFHMWAMRHRARQQVTLDSLSARMKKEGFNFDRSDYVRVLKRLADLGLGKISTDYQGRVKGLTGVQLTLQSIGKAACGDDAKPDFDKIRKNNLYRKLDNERKVAVSLPETKLGKAIKVIVPVKNQAVEISIPNTLTAEELGAFIAKIREL